MCECLFSWIDDSEEGVFIVNGIVYLQSCVMSVGEMYKGVMLWIERWVQ